MGLGNSSQEGNPTAHAKHREGLRALDIASLHKAAANGHVAPISQIRDLGAMKPYLHYTTVWQVNRTAKYCCLFLSEIVLKSILPFCPIVWVQAILSLSSCLLLV